MIRRAWLTTGAVLGWSALVLQLCLTIRLSMANGGSLAGSVVFYLSFFTILTNLLISAEFAFLRWASKGVLREWLSGPGQQAAFAAYIVTVGATYSLLLRHIWNPQGLQKLADILLHDVMPLLYLGYWLSFAPKHGLRWTDSLRWLGYPLVYLAYSLGRGAVTGFYPYPFIDAGVLGYRRTMVNATLLTLAFLALELVVIAVGRALAKRQKTCHV